LGGSGGHGCGHLSPIGRDRKQAQRGRTALLSGCGAARGHRLAAAAAAWAECYRTGRYWTGLGPALAFLRESRQIRIREHRERRQARLERKQARVERERLLQERSEQDRQARRTARNWSMGLGALAILMLLLAGYAFYLWNDAQEKTRIAEPAEQSATLAAKEAESAREDAENQRNRAEDQLLKANINLARVHEEKSLALLERAFKTERAGDYRRALLQALQAQRQPIQGKPGLQPTGRGRLTDPRIVQAFAERWRSPAPILGSRPNGIAWSPDGTQLAMAQADGSIRVWDTETGRSLYRLTGHDKSVVSVAFSGDGQRLASGSDEETVRVWGDLRGMFLFLNGPAPSPRAALTSEALQRLWRLRPDGLDIESETWTWLQARDGYYVDQEFRIDIRPAAATADPDSKPILRSFNMRPLLDPPPGKDKLDQLLDWLKEQEPRLQP